MKILFYTTVGCHLCEQAAQHVSEVRADFEGLDIVEIDIADSDELVELYGIRIPVIKLEGQDEDLGWPFDVAQLQSYLATTR